MIEWLSEYIIEVLMAIAAYWAGWYSKKQADLSGKGIELEEQREKKKEEEANKAMIVPRMTTGVARSGKTKFLLSILNKGQSEARNVRVFINGQPPTECPHILTNENSIEVIGPSNQFDFIVAKDKDTEPSWTVKVIWEDDFESNIEMRTTLKA